MGSRQSALPKLRQNTANLVEGLRYSACSRLSATMPPPAEQWMRPFSVTSVRMVMLVSMVPQALR